MRNELEILISSLVNHSDTCTIGLPELTEEMIEDISHNVNMLRCACELFLEEVKTFDDVNDNRGNFHRIYAILKIMAVNSINLMDAPSPSLPSVKENEKFQIILDESSLTIF